MRHLDRQLVESFPAVVDILLREIEVVLEYLLQVEFLDEDKQEQGCFLLALQLVGTHKRVVEDVDTEGTQLGDGHSISGHGRQECYDLVFDVMEFMFMGLP
jgi:hypothetical protein